MEEVQEDFNLLGCVPPSPVWIEETHNRLKRQREEDRIHAEEEARKKMRDMEEAALNLKEAIRTSTPDYQNKVHAVVQMISDLFGEAKVNEICWIEVRATEIRGSLLRYVCQPFTRTLFETDPRVWFRQERAMPCVLSGDARKLLVDDVLSALSVVDTKHRLEYTGSEICASKQVTITGNYRLASSEPDKLHGLDVGDFVITVAMKLE
jgi:hypothetical protein